MTKQEKIRGGIYDLLLEYCNCDSLVHCDWPNANYEPLIEVE